MIERATWHSIVCGRRRGPAAALARCLLRIAAAGYRLAVAIRNRAYDRGWLPVRGVEVPVVCVGNLTVGGTGKTPLVAWLARWYRARGMRVGLISRGYRHGQAGSNDEADQLYQELPDVPHVQNPDRLAAARLAIDELEMELLIMDDGFQHRRLRRDLDLVLLDALEPFGYGRLLPAGLLREPAGGLRRADAVVLTRADLVSSQQRTAIRSTVERLAPRACWVEAAHRPLGLRTASGRLFPLDRLAGQPIAAFCGLGNPQGFFRTLDQCGYRVAGRREFPDHHRYTRADLDELAAWAERIGAAALVCTHKDLVKLGADRLGATPLLALTVELAILAGSDALESLLRRHVRPDPLPAAASGSGEPLRGR